MTEYYSYSSFLLPLDNDEMQFVIDVITCLESGDFLGVDTKANLLNKNPKAYKVVQALLEHSDTLPEHFMLGFIYEPLEKGLFITHDESMDDLMAAQFVYQTLKALDRNDFVSFSVANTVSEKSTNGCGFGGKAYFITKSGIDVHDTIDWITKKESEFSNNQKEVKSCLILQ
jgi:hypothetical protein